MKLDIDGIVGTIASYTNEVYVKNICDRLKSSINRNDLGEIGYFLQKLKDWYEENQSKIQSNQYVRDKRFHIEIEKEIASYMEELDIYIKERKDIVENESVTDDIEKTNDISGIVYIELDNQKAWRFNIARDMKKLG